MKRYSTLMILAGTLLFAVTVSGLPQLVKDRTIMIVSIIVVCLSFLYKGVLHSYLSSHVIHEDSEPDTHSVRQSDKQRMSGVFADGASTPLPEDEEEDDGPAKNFIYQQSTIRRRIQ
jgi:hypothetical protein